MRELLILKQIIQEMGICLVESKILCDNQSAIKIFKSEGMLERTKHRYLILEKELRVEYVPTEKMLLICSQSLYLGLSMNAIESF
jgi:hypothetical protein